MHTINGTNTLPTDHEEALLSLAAVKACQQQKADSTNALNTGGAATTRDWDALIARHQGDYDRTLTPRRGIRQHRLYAPVEPGPSQSSDPGPA